MEQTQLLCADIALACGALYMRKASGTGQEEALAKEELKTNQCLLCALASLKLVCTSKLKTGPFPLTFAKIKVLL
jgi:hypothetical protein